MSTWYLFSAPARRAARVSARVACLGLLARRERWGLTARGCIAIAVAAFAAATLSIFAIHPFLAVTQRAPADFLAVEGWVPDYAIRAAADEFSSGNYRSVFATGGPVHGVGAYRNDFSTAASIGARKLTEAGLPPECVHMVPSRTSERDRTYASAVALRDWLRAQHRTLQNLNVLTESVHARRTRLLFQLAFGDSVNVGVIAVPNPDYDARRWWRYSEGVRDVIGEAIAYVYAKFFFVPPPLPAPEPSGTARPGIT